MVNFINCGRKEFICRTKGKAVYCFGAGKYLKDFAKEEYGIPIKGIIDNYRRADALSVTFYGIEAKIVSIERFLELYDDTCAVVITSSFFAEILEQLDSLEQLVGMDCYIDLFIRRYADEKMDLELDMLQARRRKQDIFCYGNGMGQGSGDTRRYQIWEYAGEDYVAGGKAPRDIKSILESRGYETISIHPYKEGDGESEESWSYQRLREEWKKGYDRIDPNSLLFLQYPFRQRQKERRQMLSRLKAEKNIGIITLLHDVEQLRKIFLHTFSEGDFRFLTDISDAVIVHNRRMREYFIETGMDGKKLVSLDLFDYLYHETDFQKQFEKSIVIAGNLDKRKSPYIGELGKLKPLHIHLYGPNYTNKPDEWEDGESIIYHGSFPSNEIPQILDRGFGLVWDGDSLDTCSGSTGEYLRYNNPHKLSLYLASGLPVIIWKEAAEAAFVEKHGVGFTVNSLYEIQKLLENVTKEQYVRFLSQVQKISAKLIQGEYTRLAVEKAENIAKAGLSE